MTLTWLAGPPAAPLNLTGDSLRFMVGSILGNRVRRVEDPELIDGRSTYVDDLRIPGTAHAVFVRSPLAHATITHLDTSNAERSPGVLAVHTAATLGREWVPSFAEVHELVGHGPLADGVVRYVGDPVALVVAETRAQAVDAAELVDVDYDLLDVVVDMEEALAPGAPLQFPEVGSNVAESVRAVHPEDAGDVLADAEVVVRARIENQRIATAPIEGNAILVDPRPDGDTLLTAYVATQHPHLTRDLLAKYTGLDEAAAAGGRAARRRRVRRQGRDPLPPRRDRRRRPARWGGRWRGPRPAARRCSRCTAGPRCSSPSSG